MKKILPIITILLICGCSSDDSSPTGGSLPDDPLPDNTLIDNVSAANGGISAAIDGNDNMHVAYFEFNRGIKYATNKSGGWAATMVHPEDTTLTMSVFNDIAVDTAGFVHIVYTTSGLTMSDTSAVYYATNKTGSWIRTKIAFTTNSSFSGCGIALTGAGKAHIAYGNKTMELFYTNNLAGPWISPVVVGSYWASVRPRLAAGPGDNVYLAYEHGGEGTLHLQQINAAGALGSNTIIAGVPSSGESKGWSPDIAVNPLTGSPLVVYWNYDDKRLNLYTEGNITMIDSLANWTEASITTDHNGHTYISYTDRSTNELYMVTDKSGAWAAEKMAVSANSMYSAIMVESTGKVDIVYCPTGVNALRVISK